MSTEEEFVKVVTGFGIADIHGGTSCIKAECAKKLFERLQSEGLFVLQYDEARVAAIKECYEIVKDLRDLYKDQLALIDGNSEPKRKELIGGTVALADIESQIEDLFYRDKDNTITHEIRKD